MRDRVGWLLALVVVAIAACGEPETPPTPSPAPPFVAATVPTPPPAPAQTPSVPTIAPTLTPTASPVPTHTCMDRTHGGRVFGDMVDTFEYVSPNPPKDTDGRREESGRGVRELQGK